MISPLLVVLIEDRQKWYHRAQQRIPITYRRQTLLFGRPFAAQKQRSSTPPYRFEGLNNFSLYLEADEEMLSAERSLVDKYLNHPLGSTGKNSIYRAAKINPLLTFSEVGRSFSIPDGGQQSIAYQEVSIIIPVVVQDMKVAGYFLPILFVDGPSAGNDQLQGSVPIVIGREMYGLPKIPATIEFDFNGQHINSGSVSFYGEEVITLTGKSAQPVTRITRGSISPNEYSEKSNRTVTIRMAKPRAAIRLT